MCIESILKCFLGKTYNYCVCHIQQLKAALLVFSKSLSFSWLVADQITTQEPLHDACNIKQNLVSQQQFCCFCIVGCGIERFKSEWLRNNPNSISHVLGAPWLIIFVKKTPLLGSEACVFLVRVSPGHVPSQSLGVGPRHQWFRNSSGDFQDSQGWQAVPIQASCTLHHPGDYKRLCVLASTSRSSQLIWNVLWAPDV